MTVKSDVVLSYDITSSSWRREPRTLNSARMSASATCIGCRIYIAGGIGNTKLTSLEWLDVSKAD